LGKNYQSNFLYFIIVDLFLTDDFALCA
jgi:hypothetical protein